MHRMAKRGPLRTVTSFPFGRENQTSVEELFNFFKSCLSSGKWELARACVPELVAQKDLLGVDVVNHIRSCSDHPEAYCHGSSTVKSADHLSWLCVQECNRFSAEEKSSINLRDKADNVEFRLLLFEATNLPMEVTKELYLYNKAVSDQGAANANYTLSKQAMDSLSELLSENPTLGHNILSAIGHRNVPASVDIREEIQLLYLQNLQKSVNLLKSQVYTDSFVSSNKHKQCLQNLNNLTESVLTILSLFDPSPDMSSIKKSLAVVFKDLIFLSSIEIANKPVLPKSAIYSALIGRQTVYLIEEFCQVDYILENSALGNVAMLDEFVEKTFAASMCDDRSQAWKKMYMMCEKYRKHFLESVVETAVTFIKTKDFDRLEQLFQPAELAPLKPLVLLLGWNHCYSCANAQRALEILWNKKEMNKDKLLEQACKRLAYQVDLVQWCLDKARPLLLASGAPVTLHQRASAMFHGLEKHSVLYVLHQSTQLCGLEASEVYEILNKCPVMSQSDSKIRKVHFQDSSPKKAAPKATSQIDIEKERDIAIYRSYCVLNHFMEALAFCVDLSNPELQITSQMRSRSSSTECSSGENPQGISRLSSGGKDFNIPHNISKEEFQNRYTSSVVNNLQKGREELSKIFPLTYRVEVLEDIFSLLFVTHEHLQEMTSAVSDDSGEDGPADETKSLSLCPSEDPRSSDGDDHVLNSNFDGANNNDSTSAIDKETSCGKFTFTKTELNDMSSEHDKKITNISESASVRSATSTCSLYQLGFVANEHVMRDILSTFKECIVDVNTAKFRLHGKEKEPLLAGGRDTSVDIGITSYQEQELSTHVSSSVTSQTLQQRMMRLQQFISEASWRYQLVSHDHIPKQHGTVTMETVPKREDAISDDELDGVLYEDDLDSPDGSQGSSQRNSPLSSEGKNEKRTDSSLSAVDSEAHTDSGNSTGKRKKKRRSRSATRFRKSTSTYHVQSNNIVPRMLASQDSLLSMCLKRKNITQANQVVKMFHMQEKPEAAEVIFSEPYSSALKKLQNLDCNYKPVSKGRGVLAKSCLSSIANVAAVGMATMGVMGIVDEVFSCSAVPGFPSDLVEEASSLQTFAEHIQPDNIPAMIIFDMACVGCASWEGCHDLLTLVRKRLHSGSTKPTEQNGSLPTKKVSKNEEPVKGLSGCLSQFMSLVGQGNSSDTSSLMEPEKFDEWFRRGVPHILSESTQSLHLSSYRSYVNSLQELEKAINKVTTEQDKQATNIKTVSPSPGSPTRSATGVAMAIKKLIHSAGKYIPVGGILIDLYRKHTKVSKEGNLNYLASLYDHVKGLAVMVAECEGRMKGDMPTDYFRVLSEGPTLILGRLIFMRKISPLRLESMAKKLNLNLTHIIVRSCCPPLPSNCLPVSVSGHTADPVKQHGRHVMNEPSRVVTSYRHPEIVTRELLTRMLQLMKANASQDNATAVFTLGAAKSTIRTQEYAEIVDATQELAVIDLTLLASREELACFYSNILNMMYIHVMLHQTEQLVRQEAEHDRLTSSSDTCDVNYSSSIFVLPDSKLDSVLIQTKMAYKIGQLGTVSLFELHYLIIRAGLPAPTCAHNLIADRFYRLVRTDPWYPYLPQPEPRLLFVISQGCLSSPPVQVLMPELMDTQLDAAMTDYLNHNTSINLEEFTISFPELLNWHENDFVGDSSDVESDDIKHSGLVHLAVSHTSGFTHDLLLQILNEESKDKPAPGDIPYQVNFDGFCDDFAFNFSHLPSTPTLPYSGLRRMSSLSLSLDVPSLSSSIGLTRQDSKLERANFQLTPEALDYLKTNSNLVATLVSLVCSDGLDLIEFGHESGHFDASNESSASNTLDENVQSDLNSLRSEHYQKLVRDFPVLYQHIASTVAPLIKSSSTKSDTAELPVTKTQEPRLQKLQKGLSQTGILVDEPMIPKKPVPTGSVETLLENKDPVSLLFMAPVNPALRPCTLAVHKNRLFQGVISTTLNRLLLQKNWSAILEIVNSIPKPALQNDHDLILLRDFILCCAVKEADLEFVNIPENGVAGDDTSSWNSTAPQVSSDKWKYFSQISDPDTQARAVLGSVDLWDIDVCIQLMDMCLCQSELSPGLNRAVKETVDTLKVYQRITDCAKNLHLKSSMNMKKEKSSEAFWKLKHDRLQRLSNWTSLRKTSESSPEEVLEVLLDSNSYDVARQWAALHDIPFDLKQKIEEECMLYLLSQDNADTAKSYQVLEKIKATDLDFCFQVCHSLLSKLTYQHGNILFLAQFVLDELGSELGEARKDELHLMCMGAKALLCIPQSMRSEYEHLISSPKLLLEQLIMNMKVEWAGKAFEHIRQQYGTLLDRNIGCTVTDFDSLLLQYASKAVEFPVEEVKGSVSFKDRTGSNSRPSPNSPFTTIDRAPTPVGSLKKTTMVSRPMPPSSPLYTTGADRLSQVFYVDGRFVMPAEPPTKEQWVPDSAAEDCMICQEIFSMFNRRHHCRRCGRVVCSNCSQRTSVIRGASAKTCDDCFAQIFERRHDYTEQDILNQRLKDRLSGSKFSPSPKGSSPMKGSPVRSRTNSRLPIVVMETQWKLSLDEAYNHSLREEFYYEYSPSISLCLSLLNLHSSQSDCGLHMLKLCDDLSSQLGSSNRQMDVDYNLVISMMKYLLFNAKVKFLTCGSTHGLAQCDRYQSRVDILKLLVSANCKTVPSIEELTKMDHVRRLRDKLIEDERLSLAMEISTKSGLDPAGVWAAWGFACLKSGDYIAAREKFARCLKAPVDRNVTQPSSKLLTDIVTCLESLPFTGARSVQDLLAPLKSVNALLAEPPAVNVDESNLDSPQLKECIYYLKAYGTYLFMIDFYRRHGYWMKAAQYILDKKCTPEVFIEGLLLPSINMSELHCLQDHMLMIDTSLEKWVNYLTASCRYLNKNRHMHVLYEFQLFMKDYIRAAMTCITHFYQYGARDYEQLHERVHYLTYAKKHLETFLEFHKPHGSSRRPDWSTGTETQLRLIQTANEVCRHISTVNLQIDVSRFLHLYQANMLSIQSASSSGGDVDGGAASPSNADRTVPNRPPASLFGNNKMKAETAATIMLAGNNVNDGFGLAFRIIQEFRLNSTLVYTQAARQLARQHKYNYIKQLLGCIRDSGLCDHQSYDEVIGACVRVIADDPKEAKEAESLIKMIKIDANKINAYILVGKLKSAYLAAVKVGCIEDVQRIANAACRAGQTSVKNICDKWLQQKLPKP